MPTYLAAAANPACSSCRVKPRHCGQAQMESDNLSPKMESSLRIRIQSNREREMERNRMKRTNRTIIRLLEKSLRAKDSEDLDQPNHDLEGSAPP
ncbi:hypothetical protein VTN77DRAFT_6252 [Rasamsonia byssochlamydoides]|uniref:uncharacterized protein n=1 Tax=Rasamsonia byssochlamydoides TaxID=89139 RepID=UPI003741F48F